MSILQFVNRHTLIHRLSPLTKLIILSVVIAGCMLIWIIARIPLSGFKLVLSVIAGMGVIFVLFNGFFYFRGVTPLFQFFKWTFTLEGMLLGLAVTAKIGSVFASIPILTMTTPISQLMAGLAAIRVPYKFNFAFGMAMRFVPLVQETFDDIRAAQRLRAHDVDKMNLLDKIRKGYVPLMVPLFLTLLRKSQDMDVAIESRAFGAPVKRTFMQDISLRGWDWIFIVGTVVFCGGLLAVSLALGLGAGLTGMDY